MSPLIGIVLMFAGMGIMITAVLLVVGELVPLFGWLLAGLAEGVSVAHPSPDKTVFEGITYSMLGLLWLTGSGAGISWVGTWLLSGGEEGALLGAVFTPVMLTLWWVLTLRLKRIRAAVRRSRGIPDDPWTWMKQRWGRTQ